MAAFWLNLHVSYQCRDSGVCCTAGWPVPVGRQEAPAIDRAVRAGAVRCVDASPLWLETQVGAPDSEAGVFRRTPTGACVFHRGGTQGCAVHASLGHAALPATCQHFPRVCLIDDRGIHVTLSHACPTAAALLFTQTDPIRTVEGPPPVPSRAVPEGLDVREAVPPLLSPRVAMDLASYAAWEARAVRVLAGEDAVADGGAEQAVAQLVSEAVALATWRPGGRRTLRAAVDAPEAGRVPAPETLTRGRWARLDAVRAACPAAWPWPAWPPGTAHVDAACVAPHWAAWAPVVRRFLAAHAFASWAAWHGTGPRAVAGSLVLALDVLRAEAARAVARDGAPLDAVRLTVAVREADRLLRHHADPRALARLADETAAAIAAAA